MTYQELVKQLDHTKESLIGLGVVELIILHILLRIEPQQTELIRVQKVDRFVYLISLQEAGIAAMEHSQLPGWLAKQLILLSVEDPKRQEALLEKANTLLVPQEQTMQSKEYDLSDGYRIARVCIECGFKEMALPPQPLEATIDCPLCGQHTCIQAK